ncbi:hypothetical protein ACLOAU_02470 [Niabella sp. CJ426]|uniref:hypothetical protein n=1 Tax=Niabella sp. CJ426 TaxID=3393740 RepID=UPI003D089ACB
MRGSNWSDCFPKAANTPNLSTNRFDQVALDIAVGSKSSGFETSSISLLTIVNAVNNFRKVQIVTAVFASLAYSMAVDWDESDLVKTHLIRLGILTATSSINIFVLVKNNTQPDENETDDASNR